MISGQLLHDKEWQDSNEVKDKKKPQVKLSKEFEGT